MGNRDLLPPPVHVRAGSTDIAPYVIEPDNRLPAGDVVLCHGTPWSATTWAPVARMIAAEYRVFLWDMPGYGASIGAMQDADLITQRERLATLLDFWNLDRPHLLAHDIGGAVALGAHLLDGYDLGSLYLLDIVTLDPWGSPFFRLVRQHETVFAALPSDLHAALVTQYIAGAGGDTLAPAWVDELSRPWKTPQGQPAFYHQIAQLSPEHTEPIVARLDHTRCPVRIGWGEKDPWIPVDQAVELAARLPGLVEVAVFPDAGHLVPLEATDALTRDVLAWLASANRAHP